MPAENLEDEGLPKNPNLELAQLKFHLELPKNKNDAAAKSKLLEAIKTDSKKSFFQVYLELCHRTSILICHSHLHNICVCVFVKDLIGK